MKPVSLAFIVQIGFLPFCECKRISFRAANSVTRPIRTPINQFRRYFSSPDTPVNVIVQNPGIRSIESIRGPNDLVMYRGHLAPIEFPWTRITSSIDYEVEFVGGEYLSINCNEGGYHHEFEGPMAGVLSSLELSITGRGNFSIIEHNTTFLASAQVSVSFPVPDFLPSPIVHAIEGTGSHIISERIEDDLGDLLDKVLRSSSNEISPMVESEVFPPS